MEKNRLEAFSDGVFAIVITLLVLEIKVPHVPHGELGTALFALGPKFLSFILSFIIIGVYWVAHHNMMHYVVRVDRNVLWFNIIVLLSVCIIPFPTAIIGDYPETQLACILYGVTLSLVNIAGTIFWWYCAKHGLIDAKLNPGFVNMVTRLHAAPVLIYLIAIAVSWFSVVVSYSIFISVPLFFILPNPFLARVFSRQYQ